MAREIELSRGKVAIVDDADFDWLNQWSWNAHWDPHVKGFYACRTDRTGPAQTTVRMHREILNAPAGIQVDHIDRNTLNNRRSNLRLATNQQNSCNRRTQAANPYGFKGVYASRNGRWRAQINVRRVVRHLGTFDRPEDAARAYDLAAVESFGPHAAVNGTDAT